MTLLIFLVILSILVLVHEYGHYITAKKSGIKVEEFGLGIPPRAWGKKVGETIYSINWLPFGGFVKLFGEDAFDEEALKNPRSFISKPWYTRLLVITAGVIMNFLLSVVLYYVFFISNGFKSFSLPLMFDYNFKFGTKDIKNTIVMDILPQSNADEAGLSRGDTILKINGTEVTNVDDVKFYTAKNANEVKVLVESYPSKDIKEFTFKPILSAEGSPVLGVYLGKSITLYYDKPVQKIFSGFLHTYNMLFYSVHALSSVIGESFATKDITPVSSSVAGPVGIYNVVGGIMEYSKDKLLLSLIDFIALLSLSLGFLNILPIPALDGGRLVFIIVEVLRGGKKINQELEAKIHGFGMAVLLGLFVLVTIKDIIR